MKNFTSKLLNWRKKSPVIHSGKLIQFAPENGIYSYFRYNEEETVMVIFNKNKETVQHDLSKYAERIGSFTQAINILENETVSLHGKLTLAGKSAMIFCFK